MINTHLAFGKIALDIAHLDELKELVPYREDPDMEYHRSILKTMKDPAILKIDQFLDDTDIYVDGIIENAQFLTEEMMEIGEPDLPYNSEEFGRTAYLKMLVVFFSTHLEEKFKSNIKVLCDFSNEIPISDPTKIADCEDENIRFIAAFYYKAVEFINYLYNCDFDVKEI
jgi:hypothetical protein